MKEKIKCLLRGFGIILCQFLLISAVLFVITWLVGMTIIIWVLSRT